MSIHADPTIVVTKFAGLLQPSSSFRSQDEVIPFIHICILSTKHIDEECSSSDLEDIKFVSELVRGTVYTDNEVLTMAVQHKFELSVTVMASCVSSEVSEGHGRDKNGFPRSTEAVAGPTGNLRNLNKQEKMYTELFHSTALHHSCLQGEKKRPEGPFKLPTTANSGDARYIT